MIEFLGFGDDDFGNESNIADLNSILFLFSKQANISLALVSGVCTETS